jgi:hypothetical protein
MNDLLLSALRQAGSISQYLEFRALSAEETLARLIAVLDNADLARTGHGLRVVMQRATTAGPSMATQLLIQVEAPKRYLRRG